MSRENIDIMDDINFLIDRGELELALTMIETSKKVYPKRVDLVCAEAMVYLIKQDTDKAVETLQRGLVMVPDEMDLLYNLAYCYQLREEFVLELIALRKVVNLYGYFSDVTETKDRIAWLERYLHNSSTDVPTKALVHIKKVLLIDNCYDGKVGEIAQRLDDAGIVVDCIHENLQPYFYTSAGIGKCIRKKMFFMNFNEIMEYIAMYHYDVIHFVDENDGFLEYFQEAGWPHVTTSATEFSIESLLTLYAQNLFNLRKIEKDTSSSMPSYSILLPTRNRLKYLKRTLYSLNNFKNKNFNIYVVDSSDDIYLEDSRQVVEAYENVTFIHYDPQISVHGKLTATLELVTTAYILIFPDDDIITEEGIDESISLLEADKTLYSVKGKNFYYLSVPKNLIEYDWFKGALEPTAIERIEKITEGFVPSMIYQVFRTEPFKKFYYFYENNRPIIPTVEIFQEYLYYFMVLATGKVAKLNFDLSIRDKSVQRVKELVNFDYTIDQRTFNEETKRMFSLLKKYLIELDDLPEHYEDKAGLIMDNFLINFLNVPEAFIERSQLEYNLDKLSEGIRMSWICRK